MSEDHRESPAWLMGGDEAAVDLVLADFAMPEMTGGDLARAIHATHPTLPIILVTGHVDLDLPTKLGESRILQKPYTGGELVDKITGRCIERRCGKH